MKQKVNQQARRQACAAAPCNENFTPKERECWHLRAIDRLTNLVSKLRNDYNHLYQRNQFAEAKILTQRRTLHEMNLMAKSRNEEILRLRNANNALQAVEVTPIPHFVSHGGGLKRSNDDAKS